MRIGFNPNKDQKIAPTDFFHQVIVPVHIPNQEGYFKDSFQIFQYCLESLFRTSHSKTFFTVVNNGSNKEVEDFLNELHRQGKIHEVVHTTAIGKLNAILKGLAGHQFSLVTISDADVLFLNGWQEATYEVYEAFPKTGVVATTPNPKMLRYFTSNLYLETMFSKHLKFIGVQDSEALRLFAKSINNAALFNDVHLQQYLTVSKGSVSAVVGAGHFVATYRRDALFGMSYQYSEYKMGAALSEFLDKPAFRNDMWRLTTTANFTYHMGNVKEDWMPSVLEKLKPSETAVNAPVLKKVATSALAVWLKTEVFSRIIFRKPIWRLFLRYKGLSKQEAAQY